MGPQIACLFWNLAMQFWLIYLVDLIHPFFHQFIHQSLIYLPNQSVNQSICLSIYFLSIYLSIHRSIHQSITVSIYLSIRLPVCLTISLSISWTVYLQTYLLQIPLFSIRSSTLAIPIHHLTTTRRLHGGHLVFQFNIVDPPERIQIDFHHVVSGVAPSLWPKVTESQGRPTRKNGRLGPMENRTVFPWYCSGWYVQFRKFRTPPTWGWFQKKTGNLNRWSLHNKFFPMVCPFRPALRLLDWTCEWCLEQSTHKLQPAAWTRVWLWSFERSASERCKECNKENQQHPITQSPHL